MIGIEEVTVKGSPIRSLQSFVDAELTPAQRDELFQALPSEVATRLRSPILATETVPVRMLNRLTEEAARVRGEPLDQFARRAGRAAAADALRGVLRFFVLVLTPVALLGKAASIWRTMYSHGEMKVEVISDHSARVVVSDFPSEPAFCGRISGWIEQMGEMARAKNARIVHSRCRSKGAPHCQWDLAWD